jgi:hypothetical protein
LAARKIQFPSYWESIVCASSLSKQQAKKKSDALRFHQHPQSTIPPNTFHFNGGLVKDCQSTFYYWATAAAYTCKKNKS